MKSLFFSSLILTILGLTVVSCNKDKIEPTSKTAYTSTIDYTLNEIPLIENNQDIHQLMLSPNDQDEEKLNKYLYEIGLATKDLIKDEDFNQVIIDMAIESGTETAFLLDLEEKSPKYFAIINQNLSKKQLSLQAIANDMTHRPINPNPKFPETAEVEKYLPAIFIPNLNDIDKNKQPLLSPNIETNCTNHPEIEDYVITWYFDVDGNEKEIILGEETSKSTANPLFFIDHAVKFTRFPVDHTDISEDRATTGTARTFTSTASKYYSIKSGYKYENTGQSEYWIDARRIRSDGATWMFYNTNPGGKELVKVSNTNTSYYSYKIHAPEHWLPEADNKFYWNTYERDWNRSSKPMGSATNWGASISLEGRRRFSGEWYAWIPNTVQIHATPFHFFGWETHVNFESWKATYDVYRI